VQHAVNVKYDHNERKNCPTRADLEVLRILVFMVSCNKIHHTGWPRKW